MSRELGKRTPRATMLARMGELLQSCIDRDEVFAAALGFAPKIFPAARGAVALLNASRNLTDGIGSWTGFHLSPTGFEPTSFWALRPGPPHPVLPTDPP